MGTLSKPVVAPDDGIQIRLCRDEHDEAAALEEFWHASKHRLIVGFNNREFDMKMLQQRSFYLSVPAPVLDLGRWAKHKRVVDLFDELTFNDPRGGVAIMKRSLKGFARRLEFPSYDNTDGAAVPALVEAGDWDAIEQHCRHDIDTTIALARRKGFLSTERLPGLGATDVRPIVVDIETAPLPNAADYVDPPDLTDIRAPSNYKAEEAIADYVARETAKRLANHQEGINAKAALDFNLARIVALGWWISQ